MNTNTNTADTKPADTKITAQLACEAIADNPSAVDRDTAVAVLRVAYDSGVTSFYTSPVVAHFDIVPNDL